MRRSAIRLGSSRRRGVRVLAVRVGAVAGLGLATTLALLPSGPAFGAGRHHQRPDPPLQAAHIVSLARGGKPVLSNQPADYIPATIGGKKVVLDPRSTVGHTDPSCEIPPDVAAVIRDPKPLYFGLQVALGGLWDCPAGPFVAGLYAVKDAPVPKLSKQGLSADPGSVNTTTVKVNGKRVKVFTYRVTIPTGPNATLDADPAPGRQLWAASSEPHGWRARSKGPPAHLLISAVISAPPSSGNPVQYLTAMLKAGAGKAPRAG
jgi:hypothetical protein